MTTPRIEKALESWNKLFQTVVDVRESDVLGKIVTTTGGLNDEQKDWFVKHMEEAHQAGIDEAVEIIKEELRNAPLEIQMTKGVFFGKVIKALQDNK